MRYRLRTLLIVLALGPPLLAGLWLARDVAQVLIVTGPGVLIAGLLIYIALYVVLGLCISGLLNRTIDPSKAFWAKRRTRR